jgi:LysM repeat protein
MQNKLPLLALFFMLLCGKAAAQVDTTAVVVDSVAIDPVDLVFSDNIITNTSTLNLFFEKLYLLETQKGRKVNIVHIGDSHIQADLMTSIIRKGLQQRFGNGGSGFTFPHSLANTNGSSYIRYSSNGSWLNRRNVSVPNGMLVGLSGIALSTKSNFAVDINVRDSAYAFNTVKIITPRNIKYFDLATSSKTIVLESTIPKKITHRIKSGEVLGTIADKYGTTVAQLKKVNGLKSNNIRAGKTLKIPTGEMEKREVKRSEFIPLELESDSITNYYHSDVPLTKIYMLPNKEQSNYNLNGLILEKDDAGILYHSIGVNGAKCSDYNKYPLFFEQLPALKPDLVIVSLGTNETFDKMGSTAYLEQLNLFIENVRAKNPEACIVVMTPPPSMFKRKYPNTFAADYAKQIVMQESAKKYASWDLFSVLGGLFSVNYNASQGLMATDKVHYSKPGYEKQGVLFTEALLQAYDNFKTNRN